MSQLPSQSPIVPPPAPKGAEWIDLPTAAARSGRSVGHWRRLCGQQYFAEGLARQSGGHGKRASWQIREDADPSIARVKFAEQMSFDLRTLTDKQRATVNARLRIIQRWETERAAGITLGLTEAKITANFLDRLLIEEGKTLSRRTLFNWLAGYRREGIAGLVDDRWKQAAGSGQQADPFLEEVKRLFLTLRRLKITVCHEIASLKADEQGWQKRTYKDCQRFIESIPRAVVLKHRFGEEAHTNEAQPFIERDYSTLASNEVWVGDHHRFDVMVKTGERMNARSGEMEPVHDRPWLTAWQDARSRKIVGYSIFAHDPNQDTILEAFRMAVLEHGVPERVYVDNGKDYDSYALQGQTKKERRQRIRVSFDADHVAGVFTQLGVAVTHCQPYHGQSKPIERFFGTVEDRFGRTWETYFSKDPQHRPEDYEKNLAAGKAPTLADFIEAFILWLTTDYHQRGHAGDSMDGQSPDQVFAAQLATKRTAPAELVDLLLLKSTKPVKVGQNGVTWNHLHYGQHEPALHAMLGKQVVLRVDPRDVGRVSVWTIEGRFVCVAESNRRLPFNTDQQTVRGAISEKKRLRKVHDDYHQARPHMHEDITDLALRGAASRNRAAGTDKPDPSLLPPSYQPVRSDLEAQLPALQRAYERPRIAVGAESVSSLSSSYAGSGRDDSTGSALGDVTNYLKYRPEDQHER